MCLSPMSFDKRTKSSSCSAILTSSFELWNNAAQCLPRRNPSDSPTDQVHAVKLPHVRGILNSIHARDQSAKFVFVIFLSMFRWKAEYTFSFFTSLWAVLWKCALLMS